MPAVETQQCFVFSPNISPLLKEHDRDLRTPTEKPGFLPNLRVTTQYFRKKAGFGTPHAKAIAKNGLTRNILLLVFSY